MALGSSSSLLDQGIAVDEQDEWEAIDRVAEWLENDHLSFLKGRVTVFTAFPVAFLSDVALLEMVDDFVDPVSDNLATMVSFNNIPLLTQSNL